MTRQTVNQLCTILPVIMSTIAFGMIVSAVALGWARPQPDGDEGAPARIFQLLILGQVPFLVAIVATADWSQWHKTGARFALAVMAILVAIFPVVYFGA